MTRTDLEQVFWLKKELKMWQRKYAELQIDIATSVKPIDDMPHAHGNCSSPTEIKALKMEEAAKNIDLKIVEIKLAITEIENYILTIDDSITRQIVQARCCENKKWDEIGKELNMERTTVAKRYNAFIRETFPHFPSGT